MTTAIADRVSEGAKWLDVNQPDWRSKVNLYTLNLRSVDDCVVGQVFSEPGNISGFEYIHDHLGSDATSELGFDVLYEDATVDGKFDRAAYDRMLDELQAEWERVLTLSS